MPARSATQVAVPPADALGAPPVGGAPRDVRDVPYQHQIGDYWCWAACASMAADYHNQGATQQKQCCLAGKLTGKGAACCVGTHPNDDCDKPCRSTHIPRAYAWCGNVPCSAMIAAPLTFADIKAVVSNERKLVEACIRWSGGGGHVVLVVGYEDADDGEWVFVHDPLPPRYPPHDPSQVPKRVSYSELCAAYDGSGTWVASWKVA